MINISNCRGLLLLMPLAGCHALVTPVPLVGHGEACLPDGCYELRLKGFENRPVQMMVIYDKTNSVYRIDAGEDGMFMALCRQECLNQVLMSFTLSSQAVKKIGRILTESEMLFVGRKYVNGRLSKNEGSYDLWVLMETNELSATCFTSASPDRLLDMVPSTNAPPFAYSGTIRRLEGNSGNIHGKEGQRSFTDNSTMDNGCR